MRFVFREFLILIESIVFIPGLLAQPDWVKSLRQNVEAFIPSQEADVVVLHNRMQIEFKDFRRARSRLEKAYKILHSVTASEYARLYEPCSSERRVEHIKGWLLRPDGSSESLKDEYILQIHPEVSAKYYDDNLVTLASYPTVRPGDIVAYEYDINEEEWESMYHTFTFHVQQPVLFSQLEVIIPDKWDLHTSGWHMDSIRYEKPNSNTYRWTGRMLPYLPEEPLMPSWSFIAQSIEFVAVPSEKQADNDFSSWRSVAVWASRVLATKETTDDTTLHQTAVRLTENCKTEEEKVRAITEYVRDAIRYVGVEIGKGRFQPRLPSITLYNKFGDCKDKAVLTCALLHEVGFEAIPALANLSKYVESELPSPFQFNHCIVAISAKLLSNSHLDGVQSGGWYFFDPTDEKTTLGTLPTALLGSRVLLPLDEDSVLVQLPTLKPENRMRIYSADLTINKKGEYSGKVSIVDYGQWALESAYGSDSKQEMTIQLRQRFSGLFPDAVFSNVSIRYEDDSTRLVFDVAGKNYLTSAGPFTMLKLDPFNATVASVLSAETRVHPIWFGGAEIIETRIRWHYGDDMQPEVAADSLVADCGARSVLVQIQNNVPHLLNMNFIQRQTNQVLPPSEYAGARRVCELRSNSVSQTAIIK